MGDEVTGNGESGTQLDILSAKIDSKPGIWTLVGIMIGLAALPFVFLKPWIDSEFDRLRDSLTSLSTKVDEASSNSAAAAANSSDAQKSSNDTFARIEKLVIAIARGDARKDAPEKYVALGRTLPEDLFFQLYTSGKLEPFLYSGFDSRDWFFVSQAAFNSLTGAEQQQLRASFEQYEVILGIE